MCNAQVACPLYPRIADMCGAPGMSALCQKRTSCRFSLRPSAGEGEMAQPASATVRPDVRFGSLAGISQGSTRVRLTPKSGRRSDQLGCTLSAHKRTSRHIGAPVRALTAEYDLRSHADANRISLCSLLSERRKRPRVHPFDITKLLRGWRCGLGRL